MIEILQKNGFPGHIIDKNIKMSLNHKIENEQPTKEGETTSRYFKLPYIGSFSAQAENKIKLLIRRFCKTGTKITLAFISTKISSYFNIKDRRLSELASSVVYKFVCNGCNSSYVGFTTRHLNERIQEHLGGLKVSEKSHVFLHLKKCKSKCSERSFTIIDRANTEFALKQKESMWIKYLRPQLNVQKKNAVILSIHV